MSHFNRKIKQELADHDCSMIWPANCQNVCANRCDFGLQLPAQSLPKERSSQLLVSSYLACSLPSDIKKLQHSNPVSILSPVSPVSRVSSWSSIEKDVSLLLKVTFVSFTIRAPLICFTWDISACWVSGHLINFVFTLF